MTKMQIRLLVLSYLSNRENRNIKTAYNNIIPRASLKLIEYVKYQNAKTLYYIAVNFIIVTNNKAEQIENAS